MRENPRAKAWLEAEAEHRLSRSQNHANAESSTLAQRYTSQALAGNVDRSGAAQLASSQGEAVRTKKPKVPA